MHTVIFFSYYILQLLHGIFSALLSGWKVNINNMKEKNVRVVNNISNRPIVLNTVHVLFHCIFLQLSAVYMSQWRFQQLVKGVAFFKKCTGI